MCLLIKSRLDSFFAALELIESFEDKYYLLAMKTTGDRLAMGGQSTFTKGNILHPKELVIDDGVVQTGPPKNSDNVDHAYLF